MTSNNSTASVRIDIDNTEEHLPRSQSSLSLTIHTQTGVSQEEKHYECFDSQEGQQNDFEKQCVYNLNYQYEQWKSNNRGRSPICIPDIFEDKKNWFIPTLNPEFANYDRTAIERREAKIKGHIDEQAVHKAFQRSTVGGMLIHGLDFTSLWKKLSESIMEISEEKMRNLKSLIDDLSKDKESFEIDFLFFHPIYGIIILECETFNNEERTGRTNYSIAMKKLDRSVRKLFELFRILIGCDCPPEFVHHLLCIPNSKKIATEESEQISILDKDDLEDNVAFEAFWKKRSAYIEHQVGCFTNENICRFIAIVYGFRSALFTSFCRDALEIHRMVDSHESSRHKNRSLTFTTNVTDQHSRSCKKAIFMNSEQICAYEKAKCVSNLVLYGPPGCGKTLLIMNLAKESAELEKPGRVVVILRYPELVAMYRKFFAADKSNQKRAIVINPFAEDLQVWLADDSLDDVFSDEVLYGGWINPKANRKNGQIIIGLTIGRCYDRANITIARDNLASRLRDADFSFFELKNVMRNTVNICEYYKRFDPDNQIVIGHNIRGRNVNEYDTESIDNACSLIVDHIKQYLNSSDCTSSDIAVLIAHEPVLSQIEKVKRSLQKAGIKVGSVVKQLQANGTKDKSMVAVDCAANVLSCEWPIVFVIDARLCPFSKSVANPIVACSRAVSSLHVINTQECNYPYLKYFCKKSFAAALLAKEREVSAFHIHDILCEINLNPSHRCLFEALFFISWFFSFFVVPVLFLHYFSFAWSNVLYADSNIFNQYIAIGIHGFTILIIPVLCIISSVLCSQDDYHYLKCTILNMIIALTVCIQIVSILLRSSVLTYFVGTFIIAFLYLSVYIVSNFFYVRGLLQREWTKSYLKANCSIFTLLRIFLQHEALNLLVIFAFLLFIVCSATNILYIYTNLFIFLLLLLTPCLYNSFKSPFRSIYSKCITIDPSA